MKQKFIYKNIEHTVKKYPKGSSHCYGNKDTGNCSNRLNKRCLGSIKGACVVYLLTHNEVIQFPYKEPTDSPINIGLYL